MFERFFRFLARTHWRMITDPIFTIQIILLIGIIMAVLLISVKHFSKNNRLVNKYIGNQLEKYKPLNGTPLQTAINVMLVTFSVSIIAYIYISFNNAHAKEFLVRAKTQKRCADLFILANKSVPGI